MNEDRTRTMPEELPGVLRKEMFAELAEYSADCCVSVYISTHRAGVEVNERLDAINFKNVLQNITQELQAKGRDATEFQRMLEPGYDLLRDDAFWLRQGDGLAAFIADDYFKYIKMPVKQNYEVIIENTFYIAPLIPLIASKEYFYLLVISKKQAKFYRATAFTMEEVHVPELPKGIDDVVHFEEKGDNDLFRMGDSGTGVANFHGMGSGEPDEKKNIAMYLEEVDETLWENGLNRDNAPLLLAGVDYLIPIYKQVAGYRHIWDEALIGNYEHENLNSLHRKARKVMEPYFRRRLSKALEDYGNKSATALTSSIPADIIPAAYYGRVSNLFVQHGEHIWGEFDEMANQLQFHPSPEDGGEYLLDNTVVKTLLNRGEVFLLEADEMPARSQMAAIFRY